MCVYDPKDKILSERDAARNAVAACAVSLLIWLYVCVRMCVCWCKRRSHVGWNPFLVKQNTYIHTYIHIFQGAAAEAQAAHLENVRVLEACQANTMAKMSQVCVCMYVFWYVYKYFVCMYVFGMYTNV